MAVQEYIPLRNVTKAQFNKYALGFEYLAGIERTVAGSGLAPIVFQPKDVLFIVVRVFVDGATALIPSLRFNQDAAANYWDRNITAAGGSNTWTNVQTPSTNQLRLAGTTSTLPRLCMGVIMNRRTSSKSGEWECSTATGTTTAGALQVGCGEWVNTAAQISQIEVLNSAGQFAADTSLGIFGKDFP